jgi:hypothetical protein
LPAVLGLPARGRVADAGLELVAQEDPASAELVAEKHTAPSEVEDCRERHVKQLGDLAGVEHVISRKARARGCGGGEGRHLAGE